MQNVESVAATIELAKANADKITAITKKIEEFPNDLSYVETRAMLLSQLGSYGLAEMDFNFCIEKNFLAPKPYLNRAVLYLHWGKLKPELWDNCFKDLNKCLSLSPEDEVRAKALSIRAKIYNAIGKKELAYKDVAAAMNIDYRYGSLFKTLKLGKKCRSK